LNFSAILRFPSTDWELKVEDLIEEQTSRGGEVVSRRAHNPKVVGSNPAPATIQDVNLGLLPHRSDVLQNKNLYSCKLII
jgi:hypothetical protein